MQERSPAIDIGTDPPRRVRGESTPLEPLIRKLERFGVLSDEEKRVVTSAVTRTRLLSPYEDLTTNGQQATDCHVLLSGMMCQYKLLSDGRRQIVGFAIEGDLCDLDELLIGHLDHGVEAMSLATVAVLPHAALSRVLDAYPRIARALWQETLVDAAIKREWVVNLGRRSAYERLSHLFCEMNFRLRSAGRSNDESFWWPVTQVHMADAMGLTTVHVNRTLQQLRGEGLIATRGKEVKILDWPSLQRVADFNPGYLLLGSAGRNGA